MSASDKQFVDARQEIKDAHKRIAHLESEVKKLTKRLEAWKTANRPAWCPESSECEPAFEREKILKAELDELKTMVAPIDGAWQTIGEWVESEKSCQ